jgi:hypothetical protein
VIHPAGGCGAVKEKCDFSEVRLHIGELLKVASVTVSVTVSAFCGF